MRFLPDHFSSLTRSFCVAEGPSGVLATPPGLVSSTNVLRVPSAPSSESLMKMWNRTGPSIDPWVHWPSIRCCATDHHPLDKPFKCSFQSTPLSAHPAYSATVSLWGSCGRLYQRPYWSPGLWCSVFGAFIISLSLCVFIIFVSPCLSLTLLGRLRYFLHLRLGMFARKQTCEFVHKHNFEHVPIEWLQFSFIWLGHFSWPDGALSNLV